MLQQFTWQHFLIAATVVTGIWYLVVILLFYRKEVFQLISGKPGQKATAVPLPHRWASGVEELEEVASPESPLIGKTKMPEGMSSITASEFGFGEISRQDQVGLVPDLLADIREVFREIAQTDGNKQDFFRRMVKVRETYPGMGGHPATPEINSYIAEHAPFHLSGEELEDLWD